jgi:hypothetical protein
LTESKNAKGGSGSTSVAAAPAPPTMELAALAQTPARTLATAFSNLVRSLLTSPATAPALAARLHELWRTVGATKLELSPDGLVSGGASLQTPHATWTFPLFMAGVRSIALKGEASPEDLIELGAQIAKLDVDEASQDAFQTWLWAEGANGFELGLLPSFVEQFEAISALDQGPGSAQAGGVSYALLDSDTLTRHELVYAHRAKALDLPLELFGAKARQREFEVSGTDLRQLRDKLQSPAHWVQSEIALLASCPQLQGYAAPARTANHLAALVKSDAQVALALLALLRRAATEFSNAIFADLARREIPSVLANQHGEICAAETALLQTLLTGETRWLPLSVALLCRAGSELGAVDPIAEMLHRIGVTAASLSPPEAAVAGAVPVPQPAAAVAPEAAVGFLRLVVRLSAQVPAPEAILRFSEIVGETLVLQYLESVPVQSLTPHWNFVAAGLRDSTPEVMERWAAHLLDPALPEGVALLGVWLPGKAIDAWAGKVKYAIARALCSNPKLRANLPLWLRNRGIALSLRLAVLETVQADPALAREVSGFQFSEWLEVAPMREALKAMRARLKASA